MMISQVFTTSNLDYPNLNKDKMSWINLTSPTLKIKNAETSKLKET